MKYEDIEGLRVSEIRELAVLEPWELINKRLNPPKPTPAQITGTIYHLLILQKDINLINEKIKIAPFKNWQTKASRDFKNSCNKDDFIILEDDFENMKKNIDVSKKNLEELFKDCLFEQEHFGDLNQFGKIKGRIDAINEKEILDLKCVNNLNFLDKKIFDFGYNLQMFLYMKLSKRFSAKLIFFHTESGLIEAKTLDYAELILECDYLLDRAKSNQKILENYNKTKEYKYKTSDYIPPAWGLQKFIENDTKGF